MQIVDGLRCLPHCVHLELDCYPWEPDLASGHLQPREPSLLPSQAVAGVFQNVAGLTGFTALSLSLHRLYGGWTTDDAANDHELWRSATFLTGLTRLVHLWLENILHVANVERDVRCLAALTALRSLQLLDNCFGRHDELLSEAEARAATAERRRIAHGFEKIESRGGFLPLLSLARVRDLRVTGPWAILQGSTITTAFNAVRFKLGQPRLQLPSPRPPPFLKFGYRRMYGVEYRTAHELYFRDEECHRW